MKLTFIIEEASREGIYYRGGVSNLALAVINVRI